MKKPEQQMLAFLFYLNLKIKVDTVISRIYFDSKCHVKSIKVYSPSNYYQCTSIWNFTKMPALPTSWFAEKLCCHFCITALD